MSGFFLDTRPVMARIRHLSENVLPDVARKGLFAVGAEILRDADSVPPKTPLKEGHLKGSKKIEVSVAIGGPVLLAGFNIEYASYVHEMVKKHPWTEPDSGPKFLQSKLSMFGKKYFAMLGEAIRRGGFNA